MNSSEQNMNSVRTFTRIFKNEHNVNGIDHLFAPNFKHNFTMPLKPGLEGFRDIGRAMNHAFPDVVLTENDLIANETTVVERSSAVATHKGDFFGAPPTGRRIHWTEMHIYRFEAGKIAEHWVEMSMLQLMQQVGAIPSPGAKNEALETVEQYFKHWSQKDYKSSRAYLADDLYFKGPFDTFQRADDLTEALTRLAPIVKEIQTRKMVGTNGNVLVIYDMVTSTSAGTVPIAEVFEVAGGKITSILAFFDPRPFVPLFEGK